MKTFIIKAYPKYKTKRAPIGYRADVRELEASNKKQVEKRLAMIIDIDQYKYLEIWEK
jgi:hypothetical protein